ncbi:MAG: dihydroorotase [Proteobacteria bacterium]|nr:dihydroorotase [Pseudomonadota bacterium]MCP4916639.1 dihydroorotase [Pseudomonadota bacterium]
MTTLIRNARLIDPAAGIDRIADLLVSPDGIQIDPADPAADDVIDATGKWAMPGLVDIQVHFRQPGFEYKETIQTGSAAALAGGITSVVVMPNTRPSLDTPELVAFESEEAERVDGIRILVAACATVGIQGEELTDHGVLKGAGAIAITDDGMPVMDDGLMEGSLRQCAEHDLLFMQHAEDIDLTEHAPMTLGPTSKALGVRGQSSEAEGMMVERDVALARKTGARYHVLHTSTKRSLDAIRAAKLEGLPVSCEVSPHHLLLTDEACAGGDPNKKMNPPLRAESDRLALVEALLDGTVDAVATDHAPHSAEEKAKGFVDAPFGVIGLETAFASVLTFVHDGRLPDTRAVELMTAGPARVLKMEGRVGTVVGEGAPADLVLVDPSETWTVTDDQLKGRSKNSCFLGRTFKGKVTHTFLRGKLRYPA